MAATRLMVFCLIVSAVSALPIGAGEYDHLQNAWELSGEFQGDILLDEGDDGRNAVLQVRRHWPNGTLYYYIDPIFDEVQVAAILAAIDDINRLTCVTLQQFTPGDTHYVHVHGDGSGCSSFIGRQRFPQRLNLAPGCFAHGTIIHEFLHALGFHHMQSTAIRDDYVVIHWDNIIPIDVPNFFKFSNETTSDFGLPYDYGSVMHYGNYAFTSNGNMTITTIDEDAVIGQRIGLSESDIIKIDVLYGCRPAPDSYSVE